MVIWVHSLPVSERQHYTTLVEEHGGDAIEEKDGTDLVTHALFDEMMLDGIEELKNLKDALPEGCVIVSKEWVDQSVNIGKAIDTKSFLV
ncbi:unnamed protein product [Toxocara canis]|nr:unnamed protein product [Toxocara canis]